MAEVVVQLRKDVSRQAWVAHLVARWLIRPVFATVPLTSWSMRAVNVLERAALQRPAPRWASVEPVQFDDFEAEWVRAEPSGPSGPSDTSGGAVLYFHGGGFLFCGLGTHRPAVASISRASGLPVLSVGYRQFPAVQLAGSVGDCVASYRFLLEHGHDPEKIVFAGDSAGGHLAFAASLQAIADGLPRPAGIVAMSPWLDLDCETKLTHPNGAREAYAPVKRLPKIAEMIAGGVTPIDPLLSPVNHDLSVLPPALIITAEAEILRCDSELMAERLAAAGVPCVLQIWEGQVHAFPVAVGLFPEAGQAIREIGGFVRGLIDGGAVSVPEAS